MELFANAVTNPTTGDYNHLNTMDSSRYSVGKTNFYLFVANFRVNCRIFTRLNSVLRFNSYDLITLSETQQRLQAVNDVDVSLNPTKVLGTG